MKITRKILHGLIPLYYLTLSACASIPLNLVNTLSRNSDTLVNKNIAYAANKKNILDIYQPARGRTQGGKVGSAPVVIFFYGGCWGACKTYTKNKYEFVAQSLSKNGVLVVIADFRIFPQYRFSDTITDAAQTVTWVKNNIHRYGGNPDNVFLMGHSSGAHLAATLVCDRRYLAQKTYQSISGLIGLAGPYDFFPFTEDYQKKVFAPKEYFYRSQPINFVTGKEPPMLLLYGDKDTTVHPRNITNMSNRVKKFGGKVDSIIYKDMSHVGLIAALSKPFQNRRPVLKDIVNFINNQGQTSK